MEKNYSDKKHFGEERLFWFRVPEGSSAGSRGSRKEKCAGKNRKMIDHILSAHRKMKRRAGTRMGARLTVLKSHTK